MARTWVVGCIGTMMLASVVATARADQIVLNNGDQLTGKIVSATGGKLTIQTALAGEVTVELKNVRTFATDQMIEIRLADGTTLKQKAIAAEAGHIKTEGGQLPPQNLAIEQIDRINPPSVKWTGSIVGSGLLTTGNSQTQSLSITGQATRRSEQDRISLGAGYMFSREKNATTGTKSTTADNWFMTGEYDYFLSKRMFVFGQVRLERDRIADLDLRATPSGGVGYQWVERPDFNVSSEAGMAWVYESYSNDGTADHIAARLAYHVDKQLTDTLKVFHNLEYLPGLERISDFNVSADAGLRAALTKTMFAELKAEWRFDATPAPGKLKNDVRYILGIGWTF